MNLANDSAAQNLAHALSDWTAALGVDAVLNDRASIAACETATFATTQRVLCILEPATTEQVALCVAIAQRHAVPIYPISRGRNWGLGSRVPVTDAAVLSLARLNTIHACDARFGALTLSPGVTFAQVHAYLAAQNSAWFLPVIGGPADASVLGNFIERGDTAGPANDRSAALCDLEIVTPTGHILRTGYSRFGDTPLSALSNTPAGPAIDGLFTQSNLGIVTRATVWLTRIPQHLQLVFTRIPHPDLAAFIDALQPLVLDLTGSAAFTLWNSHKLRAREAHSEEPAEEPDARSEEPPPLTDNPAPADDTWFFNAALYAPSAPMAAAQRQLTLHALDACAHPLDIIDEAAAPDLRQQAGLFLGVPTNDNVRSLYLRRPGPLPTAPLHPDRDRCGALWLCVEVPFTGAAVTAATALCEQHLTAQDYSPVLGLHIHSPRTVRIFVSIFYDRTRPGEDLRALQCHDALLAALAATGIHPFRLGIQSMDAIHQSAAPLWDLITQLKQAIDPNHVLAPGRYSK